MEKNHKAPRDYTLGEVQALCETTEDCNQCPFDRLKGVCSIFSTPVGWDLDDPDRKIDMAEVFPDIQKLMEEMGPDLISAVHGVSEALKTVARYLRGDCPEALTETIVLFGGETLTVTIGRERADD